MNNYVFIINRMYLCLFTGGTPPTMPKVRLIFSSIFIYKYIYSIITGCIFQWFREYTCIDSWIYYPLKMSQTGLNTLKYSIIRITWSWKTIICLGHGFTRIWARVISIIYRGKVCDIIIIVTYIVEHTYSSVLIVTYQ